jgi:hypothetical protein
VHGLPEEATLLGGEQTRVDGKEDGDIPRVLAVAGRSQPVRVPMEPIADHVFLLPTYPCSLSGAQLAVLFFKQSEDIPILIVMDILMELLLLPQLSI